MYNKLSNKAEEFISNEEILDTLEYAEKNKNNIELVKSILKKAHPIKQGDKTICNGLNHREASVLLACENKEILDEIYNLASVIKQTFYGNRVVIFAPLYLSNYCTNGCVYCPYHFKNKNIKRKKLSQEEIKNETIALQNMGNRSRGR